jgi:hypothetical protein
VATCSLRVRRGCFSDSPMVQGYICLPGDNVLHTLTLERDESGFSLAEDPLKDRNLDYPSVRVMQKRL